LNPKSQILFLKGGLLFVPSNKYERKFNQFEREKKQIFRAKN
jgi:hypothetical protein